MAKVILRRPESTNAVDSKTIQGILPTGAAIGTGTVVFEQGTPLYIASKDADTGVNTFARPGTGGMCDGFVTRDVRNFFGHSDEELLRGYGMETPFFMGDQGSIEKATHLEIEDLQTSSATVLQGSGTGAITTSTAAGTELSFGPTGRIRAAQSTDKVWAKVVAQMTPETSGNVRLFIETVSFYVKA